MTDLAVHTGPPGGPATVPMLPGWHRVVATHTETADTVTLTLEALDEPLDPARPGQFHMLYAVGVGEVPISVSSVEGDRLGFTIRSVGTVSAALAAAPIGAVIGVRGPYGTPWDLDTARTGDVVVVAGGLGLAPVRQAVRTLLADRDRPGRLSLVVGARSPDELCFVDELHAWRRRDDLDLAVTVDVADRGWWGSVGVVTALLPRAGLDPARTSALICGPEVMMRAAVRRLLHDGVPEDRLWLSMERNMRCAVGHCGHCQLGPHLLCRDGPVLAYPSVAGLLGVPEL